MIRARGFSFQQYLHIVSSFLLFSAVLLSTFAIVTGYSKASHLELSVKLTLISLSVLLLLEIMRSSRGTLMLCTLLASLTIAIHYILIATSSSLAIAVTVVHVVQALLWAWLRSLFARAPQRLTYLLTWGTLYVTISAYSRFLPVDLQYARVALVIALATIATPALLAGSTALQNVIAIESAVGEAVGQAIVARVRRVRLWAELTANKVRTMLKKVLGVSLGKAQQEKALKLVQTTARVVVSVEITVETSTMRRLERLLSHIIKCSRVLEDTIVKKVRTGMAKIVKHLHHTFEYSLATISLVLGLLILLALIIFILLAL
uniref:Uncharacterized protein n=1 Tax=Ignisphaera aggregans TaxID=334771 RepID=A0A7J3Z4U7_9CREN